MHTCHITVLNNLCINSEIQDAKTKTKEKEKVENNSLYRRQLQYTTSTQNAYLNINKEHFFNSRCRKTRLLLSSTRGCTQQM